MSTSASELVRSNMENGTPSKDAGTNHGHHAFYHTMMRDDFEDPNPESEVPTSQFISEGNGGEFRKSYHGYPQVQSSSPKSGFLPIPRDSPN